MKRYEAEIKECTRTGIGHPVLRRGAMQHHFDDPFEAWLRVQRGWTEKKRIKVFFYKEAVKDALPITVRPRRPPTGVYVGGMRAYSGIPCGRWREFFAYWKWVRFK